MIERCDMETQAGSHCQRHGLHLTPQALSLSHSLNPAMAFSSSASFCGICTIIMNISSPNALVYSLLTIIHSLNAGLLRAHGGTEASHQEKSMLLSHWHTVALKHNVGFCVRAKLCWSGWFKKKRSEKSVFGSRRTSNAHSFLCNRKFDSTVGQNAFKCDN